MRRFLPLVLFILLVFFLLTSVGAQEGIPTAVPDATPLPLHAAPAQMVSLDPAAETVPVAELNGPPIFAVSAADVCDSATELTVPGGGSAIVNTFNSDGDQPLSCAWRPPLEPEGYRSAWYYFVAPSNGMITISTAGSSYDTVVTVYQYTDPIDDPPACSTFDQDSVEVACNDDALGFSSRVSFAVSKDKVYYVKVSDWQEGVSGNAELRISLEKDPINSFWTQQGNMSLARSRHATAIVGPDIYVIGGQTANISGNPTLTNRIDRYETDTGKWVALGQMPGVGLSNTTAVYVNKINSQGGCTQGCIYVPGGYNGNNTTFNGTHHVYDVATGDWNEKSTIGDEPGWPDGEPLAWAAGIARPDQSGYYLLGGQTAGGSITDAVHFYHVSENAAVDDKWSLVSSMNAARYGHMTAYLNGRICVVGGITTGPLLVPDGECWNVGGGNWQQTIPALNTARFGAGSAVGPDGKWYIYGGTDATFQPVSTVEVYDPANEAAGWVELPVSYALGGSDNILARAWPRGGFVGNYLWAVGGHSTVNGSMPIINIMQRLFVGQFNNMMPIVLNFEADNVPDETLAQAQPLAFNVSKFSDFDAILDLYDFYYFDLPVADTITVELAQIPGGSNYDLFIYDNEKEILASGQNPSNLVETITQTLDPGRYYLLVERAAPLGFPDTDDYRLRVLR